MSLLCLHRQHEAQWGSAPAWKRYTGDATAEFTNHAAQALPLSDVNAFSKLAALPEMAAGHHCSALSCY